MAARLQNAGRAIGALLHNPAKLSLGLTMKTYSGGCHCGAVRFEVDAPEPLEALECNCSMCIRTGFLHLIAPKSRFRLQQGEAELSRYTFNTGVAQHLFCSTCGVKSFYVPRPNPDGFSVNVRCLDGYPELPLRLGSFDGRNWERHGGDLAGLSKTETKL